ncbi:MAG: cytidylate kinase-like family protein [Oscillospiraceae bacterium]|nr:cytidylate kinase-like family protein [Candidatus Ruminococcus equi]
MDNKYIITIARQFGSGGRAIGQKLAEKLGIDFYDKELISLAAKESGINPEVFESVDEKAANSLLYSLSMGLYSFSSGFSAMGDLPVNDKLYILQHKIIRDLAAKGPCVIVGRCADYILKDHDRCISVFIHANMEYRKTRAVEVHNIDKDRAEHIINRTDKSRANYYSFYSGQKWGLAENYNLCVDSSKLSEDQIVDLIISYLEIKDK